MVTFAEETLSRASGEEARAGNIVNANVDYAMSHDNAALVIKKFREIGKDTVWDSGKIIIILDHRTPANTIKTAEGHHSIREFVKEQGINNFYDINRGICHQVMIEEGFASPGRLMVGTDSHTTSYGAAGAFSTGIGATEMAAVWATGKIWLKVPESYRVVIEGDLPEMVFSKDIILNVIRHLRSDGANYKACEFYGTVEKMSTSSKIVISNMSMEMGAKAAVFPPREYDGPYEKEFEFDISNLSPQVACPHTVDNVKDIREVQGKKINQAVLGSCTNGRLEDLRIAASIIEDRKVAEGTRMLVFPASINIYKDALKEGLLEAFIEAGALVLNPGCGPCLGAHEGILAAGEVAIASTNRNFRGRMGSRDSEVYLASPATVAASALKGEITDPRRLV
jgi:3-isopropylmalate dehydratase large subunit